MLSVLYRRLTMYCCVNTPSDSIAGLPYSTHDMVSAQSEYQRVFTITVSRSVACHTAHAADDALLHCLCSLQGLMMFLPLHIHRKTLFSISKLNNFLFCNSFSNEISLHFITNFFRNPIKIEIFFNIKTNKLNKCTCQKLKYSSRFFVEVEVKSFRYSYIVKIHFFIAISFQFIAFLDKYYKIHKISMIHVLKIPKSIYSLL